MLSREKYIPCNAPAEKLVHSPRDNRTYRMCLPCADHNARRGMKIVDSYPPIGSSSASRPPPAGSSPPP